MSLAERNIVAGPSVDLNEIASEIGNRSNGLVNLMVLGLVCNYQRNKVGEPESSSSQKFIEEYAGKREESLSPFQAVYVRINHLITTYAEYNKVTKLQASLTFLSSATRRSLGMQFADEGFWPDGPKNYNDSDLEMMSHIAQGMADTINKQSESPDNQD